MSPLIYGDTTLKADPDKSIFDYADALRVRVPTSCGRSGKCHECIVEIKQGIDAVTPPTDSEGFLSENFRLACQVYPVDLDANIEFSVLRRQPQILTHSIKRDVDLAPLAVRKCDSVYIKNTPMEAYVGMIYGLAIDIGTTTVVMNLVDLETGETLHTSSFENTQKFGGSDIMHRISYDGGDYSGELRQAILSALNFEIGEMSRQLGFHRRRIYDVVIVGNSTMRDLLFGIDVQSIGQKPYKSITQTEMEHGKRSTTSLNMSARKMGLRVFPNANVYSGPLIGSHVGADVAADLLAIGLDEKEDVVMLVDVGTNTEVVVGNRHRMMTASCPAGPAFEGGEITYGMPGYEGAVESIEIENELVKYRTIGQKTPQGICGSGLVDLLSELRRTGQMNELGVFPNQDEEFFFVPDKGMSLSRSDISALAQAKSANYSGQWIVLRHFGISPQKISKMFLAGGFANYVNTSNAASIGFIANVPPDKIEKVGNAALEGATLMLVSIKMRDVIEKLVTRIEHVELETTPDFFEIFVEGCMFKPMAQPDN